MTISAQRRWRETWALLDREAPAELLVDLTARHREPHRCYHTLDHVLDCLEKVAGVREIQEEPAAVDLALWFHDAVYTGRRSDDEVRSAALAQEALTEHLTGRLDAGLGSRVAELILATRHREPPGTGDAAVVVDADLSILGEEPAAYDAYRAAIRREYAWVPGPLYRRRRAKLLRTFLDRPRIFTTAPFHDRYETGARSNLRRELAELRSPRSRTSPPAGRARRE